MFADATYLLLVVLAAAIAVFYVWYAYSSVRKKPLTGREGLVGAKGIVYSETLAREGEVSIDGVIWKASLADLSLRELKKRDEVVVRRVQDLTLFVEREASTDNRPRDATVSL